MLLPGRGADRLQPSQVRSDSWSIELAGGVGRRVGWLGRPGDADLCEAFIGDFHDAAGEVEGMVAAQALVQRAPGAGVGIENVEPVAAVRSSAKRSGGAAGLPSSRVFRASERLKSSFSALARPVRTSETPPVRNDGTPASVGASMARFGEPVICFASVAPMLIVFSAAPSTSTCTTSMSAAGGDHRPAETSPLLAAAANTRGRCTVAQR